MPHKLPMEERPFFNDLCSTAVVFSMEIKVTCENAFLLFVWFFNGCELFFTGSFSINVTVSLKFSQIVDILHGLNWIFRGTFLRLFHGWDIFPEVHLLLFCHTEHVYLKKDG